MSITKYIWDVETDSYLLETDDTGATTVVYSGEPVQFGAMLSQHRETATAFHHFDALGSTCELTDSSGSITDTYRYTAWGEELASSGMTVNWFRWGGRIGYYWDSDTDTYYIRWRSYNPVIARWTSRDPLMFADSDPMSPVPHAIRLNYILADRSSTAYTYAGNGPITLVDPSGLQAQAPRAECPWHLRYLSLLFFCICQGIDRGWPHHRGGGSIAHCVAHCHIATYCGGCIIGPSVGSAILSQTVGLVFELIDWHEDAPLDLRANAIGVLCSASLESCETCCQRDSAFNP